MCAGSLCYDTAFNIKPDYFKYMVHNKDMLSIYILSDSADKNETIF
jgi:hypothetical protein